MTAVDSLDDTSIPASFSSTPLRDLNDRKTMFTALGIRTSGLKVKA
jgi:hypothetical protein